MNFDLNVKRAGALIVFTIYANEPQKNHCMCPNRLIFYRLAFDIWRVCNLYVWFEWKKIRELLLLLPHASIIVYISTYWNYSHQTWRYIKKLWQYIYNMHNCSFKVNWQHSIGKKITRRAKVAGWLRFHLTNKSAPFYSPRFAFYVRFPLITAFLMFIPAFI